MKRKNLAVCVCIVTLIIATGCGGKKEDTEPVEIVEVYNQSEDIEPVSERDIKQASKAEDIKQASETGETGEVERTENTEENEFTDLTTDNVPEAEIDEDKFKDELYGDVIEINSSEKTVMVNKLYTEIDSEGNGIMVASANDEDTEKIKVCFTSEADYILETGKADGTNVTQSEAAFSDIQEGDILKLRGLEAVTGDEFLATWVKIERVIN
mgnify:FL=1